MISIEVNNKKIPELLFRISDIVFTEIEAKGLLFSHNDASLIQQGIANKLVKRILVDNGSLVELIFKEILVSMGWELNEILKVGVMNLVGFSGETSVHLL